jgi:hypothetical protein
MAVIYALYVIAAANVALTSFFALQALANPRTLVTGKVTPGMRTLTYFGAMRTFALAVATIAAIVTGAREAAVWLSGVGAAVILFDSIPGQQQNNPGRALIPLGLGVAQTILLILTLRSAATFP